MQVIYDERKLTELLMYVAGQLLPDTAGGATKINKVLLLRRFRPCATHGLAHHWGRLSEARSWPGPSSAQADPRLARGERRCRDLDGGLPRILGAPAHSETGGRHLGVLRSGTRHHRQGDRGPAWSERCARSATSRTRRPAGDSSISATRSRTRRLFLEPLRSRRRPVAGSNGLRHRNTVYSRHDPPRPRRRSSPPQGARRVR